MIAVGVDTHEQAHVAAALSELGELLSEIGVAANPAGYREMAWWLRSLGDGVLVGIEGASSYGAGLCEHLQEAGAQVVEVERPRRRDRRTGKSDRIDARMAAKKVLSGEGLSTPRAPGARAGLQALLLAYRSCVGERTRLRNQVQALHVTAPVALRERIANGDGAALARRLASMRVRSDVGVQELTTFAVMRDLARRARALEAQARHYESAISQLAHSLDPTLLDEPGIGPISAGKLLACDPARFTSEAAFARCNGTAPQPASSGQTVRHRLSRGGDRQANSAIHTIALSRSLHHAQTRAYLERRLSEGKTRREAMRALKRHLSRSLFKRLVEVPLTS
jgi:transposase